MGSSITQNGKNIYQLNLLPTSGLKSFPNESLTIKHLLTLFPQHFRWLLVCNLAVPIQHFWKEITNKQSSKLDYCIQLSFSLGVPGDHTATSAHHLTAVALIPLTVAKKSIVWMHTKMKHYTVCFYVCVCAYHRMWEVICTINAQIQWWF